MKYDYFPYIYVICVCFEKVNSIRSSWTIRHIKHILEVVKQCKQNYVSLRAWAEEFTLIPSINKERANIHLHIKLNCLKRIEVFLQMTIFDFDKEVYSQGSDMKMKRDRVHLICHFTKKLGISTYGEASFRKQVQIT